MTDRHAAGAAPSGQPLPRLATDRTGHRVRIRPIRTEDWRELQEGYETWSPEQKRMRMHATIAHLTEGMARDFATVEDPRHEACLVLTPEEDDADLLGGARLAGAPGRADGEFAVSIRADAQGRGLGRIALEAVLAEARRLGIRRAWGLISRRNRAMLALAERLGFALRPCEGDASLLVAERDL